ncbi:MAG: ATP-binding cassette domain-containing protein, partial [Clostridia bacterium]|nr:ATP-binding cassette domain-containing protein [Clostridia bacterium]
MTNESTPLLQLKDIVKNFPGVAALKKVSLSVRSGTVHALMGENGAGKSTLMKCLFGIYKQDSGQILLEGEEVSFSSPREALERGVAMVHQELNQALKRNVMDNLWLGRYPKLLGIAVSERKMYTDTQKIFKELGITTDPRTEMSKLSVAQRQMIEIAKAVSYRAKIIVLDEPTSSLTEQEVEKLFSIIDMLKKRGCGIIYISHKMEEILRISDDITVMRDGEWITTQPASEMTMDKIIRLMVGRELTERFPPKRAVPGEVIFEARGIGSRYAAVKNAS